MGSDPARVALKLANDARLVGGVGATVAFFADNAGLDAAAQAGMAGAAEQACRETFPLLSSEDSTVDVLVEHLEDSIQVILEHHGQPLPTAGLETFLVPGAEPVQGMSGLNLLASFDQVQYTTEGGASRMTLVKFLRR